MTKKLKRLENYIEGHLLENLPVNYRFLDYFDIGTNSSLHVKTIEVTQYFTTQYIVSGHYKPVSKCLEQ
jgi:hypothetical protein